jgi:hypothetical protein
MIDKITLLKMQKFGKIENFQEFLGTKEPNLPLVLVQIFGSKSSFAANN